MQDQTLGNSEVNQEISGKPWWKTCSIVAGVVIVVFLIISFIFIRFVGGSGPQYTNRLPASFPTNFVLYRVGLAKQIVYYAASEKNKPIRLIMTPVRMLAQFTPQGQSFADSMDKFLGVVGQNETVTITWSDVDAKADDVLVFYSGSMRAAGITDPQMRQTAEKDVSQLVGTTNAGTKINVLLVDDPKTPKIDTITVVVEYPAAGSKK
jgi:hypothetical protein